MTARVYAVGMTALQDDKLDLRPVPEWWLPTDKDGFLAWIRARGIKLEEFKTYPAWANAPQSLKAALTE